MPFATDKWDQRAPQEIIDAGATITFAANATYRQIREQLYKGYLLATKKLDVQVQLLNIEELRTSVDCKLFTQRCNASETQTLDEIRKLQLDWLPKVFPQRVVLTSVAAVKCCRAITKKVVADKIKAQKLKDKNTKADKALRDKAALLNPRDRWRRAIVQVMADERRKPMDKMPKAEKEVNFLDYAAAPDGGGPDAVTLREPLKGKGKKGKKPQAQQGQARQAPVSQRQPSQQRRATSQPVGSSHRRFTKSQLAERKNNRTPVAGRGNQNPQGPNRARSASRQPHAQEQPRQQSRSQSRQPQGRGRGRGQAKGNGKSNNGRGRGGQRTGQRGSSRAPNV